MSKAKPTPAAEAAPLVETKEGPAPPRPRTAPPGKVNRWGDVVPTGTYELDDNEPEAESLAKPKSPAAQL